MLDDFAAVALWLGPGSQPDGETIVSVLMDSVAADQQDDVLAVLEQMDAMHPTSAHWYLPWLAVDPARQRDGLGGRLLDLSLRRVDRDGLPAYLETPNPQTIAFYERRGFQVTGQVRAADVRRSPPCCDPPGALVLGIVSEHVHLIHLGEPEDVRKRCRDHLDDVRQ